jgi:hypothetical protein
VKVGIEHPILGLMTFTLIAAMVVSAIVLLGIVGMNVQDYILKTPVTEGYATCFSESFDDVTGRYKYNVSITVANSGRVDLRLEKLYVATEKGLVELTVASQYTVRTVTVDDAVVDFEIILLGFTRDTELWAGQRGLIRINMVSNKQLYVTGGQYSVTAYLTTIGFEAFTVREARFKVGEVEECPTVPLPPPTVPGDIILVSRAALYWDTFDTNPIGSKMTLVPGAPCTAGYQASGHGRSGLVYLEVPAGNRECALLVQGVTLPNTGSIFVAFTALIEYYGTNDQPGLFGAILSWGSSLTHYYTGGFNKVDSSPSSGNIFVRVRTPATTATSSSRHVVNWNTWYNGTLALAYTLPNIPNTLAFYADRNYTSRSLATHEWLTPDRVGLSIYKLTAPRHMRAYFDSMLVTVGERPWIVRVESLQPGWRVVLKDSSGRIIDSRTAVYGGFVELNVWGVWIIKNGVIELYDSSGNPLLPPKRFSEILGGDVYRVTG